MSRRKRKREGETHRRKWRKAEGDGYGSMRPGTNERGVERGGGR